MSDNKIDRRKAQGEETKKKLYEAAERLFAKHDFNTVSVEDITNEVGITKGGFYVHFESKDALIASLIADYTARVDTDYRAFIKTLPSDMSASGVVISLVEKIADMLSNDIGYEKMNKIYEMLLARSADTNAVKGYGRELYTLIKDILEKGTKSGEFISTFPIDTLARHFVIAIRGVSYEWCVRYPQFDLKEQAVEHFKLLLGGIMSTSAQ